MNTCLIILTNYFPFHKGEEYLETEILHLAKAYTKVCVISTMVDKKMKQTRSVPNNVIVIKSGMSHSIIGKLKMILSEQKQGRISRKTYKLLKNDGKDSILKKAFSFYFECRASYIYKKIIKELDTKDINQFDKITIYSYWLYVTARIAVELKQNYFKSINPYTLSRAHGYDINEDVNSLKFLPEREFLLDSLDNVFPVSQNGVDFLKAKYPKYEQKVEVKRLGTRKVEVKKQNSNKKLNIVSCSVVRKLKRIDLLIEALELLQEKEINFKWTHIGAGPDFEKIKRLASEKLEDNNFEFAGFMKNSEVLDWYQNNPTTVFVNTSISEGVPVSIMEAMSMSLPVIATDVGGTSEIVEDNITGYLLNSKCTKEEIAISLIKFQFMNNEEYKEMCQSAYYGWYNHCNADRLYNDFVYETLLERKSI